MPASGKLATMIVHRSDPYNAETAGDDLAAHALTDADRFYVRNHGAVPDADEDAWRLQVDGLVGSELELSLDDLRAAGLPVQEVTATLQCAGNRRAGLLPVRDIPGQEPWGAGATGTATWRGVALADVLARAGGPSAAATHVAFVGADRCQEAEPTQPFGASIPLEKALRSEVLLAWEMNGEPLPATHGAPLRAIVPGYIGARSVKWLQRVQLRDRPWDGWFQDVVYRLLEPDQEAAAGRGIPLGEVALNADILTPADGTQLTAGPTELHGYAFAGGERRVVRVDVSADDGRTWTAAHLGEDQGRWAWRHWSATVDLAGGEHALRARAWDSAAATQPEDPATVWNPGGYVNNAQARITVRVR